MFLNNLSFGKKQSRVDFNRKTLSQFVLLTVRSDTINLLQCHRDIVPPPPCFSLLVMQVCWYFFFTNLMYQRYTVVTSQKFKVQKLNKYRQKFIFMSTSTCWGLVGYLVFALSTCLSVCLFVCHIDYLTQNNIFEDRIFFILPLLGKFKFQIIYPKQLFNNTGDICFTPTMYLTIF